MMARMHPVAGQKRGRPVGDEKQGGAPQTLCPWARFRRETAAFAQRIVAGDINETQAFLSRGGEWLDRRFNNGFGDTPLTLAIGNPEMVEMMLNHRCDPNESNDQDDTPLVLAVERKQPAVVKLLMKNEFECDPGLNDSRALFVSIQSKQFEVFELLLQAPETNINATDDCDCTPLMYAAGVFRSPEISSRFVSVLLAKGPKVNSLDEEDSTPLCFAYAAKNWASAKLLLHKKARASMRYGGDGLLISRERSLVNPVFRLYVERCVDEVQSDYVLGAIESLGLGRSLPRGVAPMVLEYLKYLW
jgi:hypothetical protein